VNRSRRRGPLLGRGPLSEIACPLGGNLVGGASRRVFIGRGPTALAIGCPANCRIHRLVPLQDLQEGRCACIIHSGGNEGAATPHALKSERLALHCRPACPRCRRQLRRQRRYARPRWNRRPRFRRARGASCSQTLALGSCSEKKNKSREILISSGKFKPKLHVKTAISDWIWRPSVWNWTIDDFAYARGGPLR